MTFEQKIAALVLARTPQEKQELINKFSSDTEFYLARNAPSMPLEKYMALNAEKFKPVVARAKVARDNMKNHGWTDKKYQKYVAELPEELFYDRPEFSVYLPQQQLQKNIKDFLIKYPQFRVDK